jgi:hypothetical protein
VEFSDEWLAIRNAIAKIDDAAEDRAQTQAEKAEARQEAQAERAAARAKKAIELAFAEAEARRDLAEAQEAETDARAEFTRTLTEYAEGEAEGEDVQAAAEQYGQAIYDKVNLAVLRKTKKNRVKWARAMRKRLATIAASMSGDFAPIAAVLQRLMMGIPDLSRPESDPDADVDDDGGDTSASRASAGVVQVVAPVGMPGGLISTLSPVGGANVASMAGTVSRNGPVVQINEYHAHTEVDNETLIKRMEWAATVGSLR